MFRNVTFACDLDQEAPQGLMKLLSSESCAVFPSLFSMCDYFEGDGK